VQELKGRKVCNPPSPVVLLQLNCIQPHRSIYSRHLLYL